MNAECGMRSGRSVIYDATTEDPLRKLFAEELMRMLSEICTLL